MAKSFKYIYALTNIADFQVFPNKTNFFNTMKYAYKYIGNVQGCTKELLILDF